MKKAGIIGGVGPASTLDYYIGIIEGYRKIKGDAVYPLITIESIDMFAMIDALEQRDYDKMAAQLLNAAENLTNAGADFVAIASNTPHIIWDRLQGKTRVPLISIVEATSDAIVAHAYKKVLVLGTKFTMRSGLYEIPLRKCGIEAIAPEADDIERLGNIVYPNLENGIVIPEDKAEMIRISEAYIARCGIDAVVLGCTEIPLMIHEGDLSVPIIDTVKVHVDAIVERLLK